MPIDEEKISPKALPSSRPYFEPNLKERDLLREKIIYDSHFNNGIKPSEEVKKTEKFCSYCDIELDSNALFCKLCGRAIKKSRTISLSVRREVWRRDQGQCVECGSKERLEYDHIIPFSKGGSNTARNIQLLCERCNRKKRDFI